MLRNEVDMFPHALKSERQIAKYKSLVFDATPQDKILLYATERYLNGVLK